MIIHSGRLLSLHHQKVGVVNQKMSLRVRLQIARQLGGTRVGLFLRTQQNEKDPDFLREIMFEASWIDSRCRILPSKALIFSTTDPINPSVLYEVSVSDDNSETSYIPGETIYQFIDDINDPNRKYIAKGVVVDSKQPLIVMVILLLVFNIFRNHSHTINTLLVGEKYFDYNMYEFEGDKNIIGDTSGKSCVNPDSYVTPQYSHILVKLHIWRTYNQFREILIRLRE